jgi:hypothetical protein
MSQGTQKRQCLVDRRQDSFAIIMEPVPVVLSFIDCYVESYPGYVI